MITHVNASTCTTAEPIVPHIPVPSLLTLLGLDPEISIVVNEGGITKGIARGGDLIEFSKVSGPPALGAEKSWQTIFIAQSPYRYSEGTLAEIEIRMGAWCGQYKPERVVARQNAKGHWCVVVCEDEHPGHSKEISAATFDIANRLSRNPAGMAPYTVVRELIKEEQAAYRAAAREK